MGLNIKNSATEAAIRELSTLTGEKLTVAVHNAVAEKLDRVKRGRGKQPLTEYLAALGSLQAALASQPRKTEDQP
jgi:hypothetical protein